jgi:small subunit ribosomal protein S17
MSTNKNRQRNKIKQGVVSRATMNKTVVVEVTRQVEHPVFKKIVRKTRRFLVHDENGIGKVGDKVKIVETRPISKLKRWKLVEIVKSVELDIA